MLVFDVIFCTKSYVVSFVVSKFPYCCILNFKSKNQPFMTPKNCMLNNLFILKKQINGQNILTIPTEYPDHEMFLYYHEVL